MSANIEFIILLSLNDAFLVNPVRFVGYDELYSQVSAIEVKVTTDEFENALRSLVEKKFVKEEAAGYKLEVSGRILSDDLQKPPIYDADKTLQEQRKEVFGSILTIVVGVITVLSLTVGIAVGLSSGNILFKISILIGVVIILTGVFLIYLANEVKEQVPLYVGNNNTRIVSVFRRTGKKRNQLLYGGWSNIVLGILVLVLALVVVPDSPILETPTPTYTVTATSTLYPMQTYTSTESSKPPLPKTPILTKTPITVTVKP